MVVGWVVHVIKQNPTSPLADDLARLPLVCAAAAGSDRNCYGLSRAACAGFQGKEKRGVGLHLVSDVKTVSDYAPEDAALLCAIGRLVCGWTMLEQSLEAKIATMREGMGDIRTVGARTRPTMTKLMTEIRTIVAMRDRRNAAVLTEIAAIERDMQRIDRFRALIIGGFQEPAPGGLTCRDGRNNIQHVALDQLNGEIAALEHVAQRLLAV